MLIEAGGTLDALTKPAEASLFLFAQMPAPITSRPRFRP